MAPLYRTQGDAPARPRRLTLRELASTCGNVSAFICAWENCTEPLVIQAGGPAGQPVACTPLDGTTPTPQPIQLYRGEPCVVRMAKTALDSGFASLFVVTSPALKNDIQKMMKRADLGVKPIVLEREIGRPSQEILRGPNVFGLPYVLLGALRRRAQSAFTSYRGMAMLDACQMGVTTEHLYELCRDLHAGGADVVASQTELGIHPPYLISRTFLERLDEGAGENGEGADGTGAAPQFSAVGHLFAGEALAVNHPDKPLPLSELERHLP